ncbi:HAD family hydrolase [Thermodesulforhabdus norvegica]|uniref:phosphoglycolate phosphatase n=1 Tax=Thermodesulforhabdus norvegica TaxID=39841 RepID=A0A1I4U680_9BACT|nr:HAD hydrolase-like protein [Thermodesulforhabdus norvegica]SFM84321.1 phosphoglycolate phosphatase [Thermodesulforhabdus norvegica]
MIDTFIFDFDGTLAELTINFAVLKARIEALAERYAGPLESSQLPLLERIEELARAIHIRSPHHSRDFRNRALDLVRATEIRHASEGKLFAFTRPLLASLINSGHRIAVVTRNCEAAVRIVFPDIEKFCHAFLAREHVKYVKPDPHHIERALEILGKADKTRVMIIGDHPLDIKAGIAVGVWTAGVASGRISITRLIEAGAHYVAENCLALFRQLSEKDLVRGLNLCMAANTIRAS